MGVLASVGALAEVVGCGVGAVADFDMQSAKAGAVVAKIESVQNARARRFISLTP